MYDGLEAAAAPSSLAQQQGVGGRPGALRSGSAAGHQATSQQGAARRQPSCSRWGPQPARSMGSRPIKGRLGGRRPAAGGAAGGPKCARCELCRRRAVHAPAAQRAAPAGQGSGHMCVAQPLPANTPEFGRCGALGRERWGWGACHVIDLMQRATLPRRRPRPLKPRCPGVRASTKKTTCTPISLLSPVQKLSNPVTWSPRSLPTL